MLRVLVRDALAGAMLHGFERVSFHGYRIEARRVATPEAGRVSIALSLTAGGAAELIDRVRIAVAFRSDMGSACRIDPQYAPEIAAR